MKKFILRHKKGISICGILLLVLVVLFILVQGFLFPDSSKSEYGNRLDGIQNVRISSDKLKKIETDLSAIEGVNIASAYITGRLINVVIDVKDGVEPARAKALTDTIMGNFSEEEQSYYDTQVFLTQNSNKESTYPYIGYKHRTEKSFFWSNNQ